MYDGGQTHIFTEGASYFSAPVQLKNKSCEFKMTLTTRKIYTYYDELHS